MEAALDHQVDRGGDEGYVVGAQVGGGGLDVGAAQAEARVAGVDRAARRLGQEPELLYALASVALLGGFIGARLVFILLHWSSYDDNLLGIVWPLTSGYNAIGGVLIGIGAAFFYGRWRRLALWPTLDALTPGLLVFLMAASLADFLGGAGYHRPQQKHQAHAARRESHHRFAAIETALEPLRPRFPIGGQIESIRPLEALVSELQVENSGHAVRPHLAGGARHHIPGAGL